MDEDQGVELVFRQQRVDRVPGARHAAVAVGLVLGSDLWVVQVDGVGLGQDRVPEFDRSGIGMVAIEPNDVIERSHRRVRR